MKTIAEAWAAITGQYASLFKDLKSAELTELQEVASLVADAASSVDPQRITSDEIVKLSDCVGALDEVKGELARRFATEESRRTAADELVRSIAASASTADDLAGKLDARNGRRRLPSIARLSAAQPGRTRPTRTATAWGSARTLVAGGQPVDDVAEAAAIAAKEIERMVSQRYGWGGRELVPLVSSSAQYPADRQLGGDEWGNERLLDDVTGPEALAASGGVCGPVAVDYDVVTVATNDRPVKQALAQFGAARGGVRYILPHTLAQVTTDGPAAVWTQATDANPGGNTKPHATFLCQPVQENYVDAVTSIVNFGNFQARYFPEQVQQYMETVEAVHSRLAESTLLAAIHAGSTQATYGNAELGAARDALAALDRACSAYRFRNRMPSDAPLRCIYPAYLNDMIRADLARNVPGDSGGQSERLAVSDEEILSWLKVRGINGSPTLDSVTQGNAYAGTQPLQGFGPQGNGQLNPWPLKTVAWIFHEGAWVFLDGGELNLGMVRDSTLNKTNDFQMFSETFEKAIFRGHESLEVTLTIDPTGASIGTVASSAETLGS